MLYRLRYRAVLRTARRRHAAGGPAHGPGSIWATMLEPMLHEHARLIAAAGWHVTLDYVLRRS